MWPSEMRVSQISQTSEKYRVQQTVVRYTLRMTAIALCRAPPEHAAAGRSLVCQSRIHVRVALLWMCVPVACSVSKSYAVDNPTLYNLGTYRVSAIVYLSVRVCGESRISSFWPRRARFAEICSFFKLIIYVGQIYRNSDRRT